MWFQNAKKGHYGGIDYRVHPKTLQHFKLLKWAHNDNVTAPQIHPPPNDKMYVIAFFLARVFDLLKHGGFIGIML